MFINTGLKINNMVEVYKISQNGEISEIKREPFSDETKDLEDFIIKNEGILGTVALVNHQITIPTIPKGIIDIWGLDTLELRPVIVELKNYISGLEIISQILPYYKFVKSNPDTLRLKIISNEIFMKKLKELGIDSEKINKGLEGEPKVIIVAPGFKQDLIDTIEHINFEIELVELSRYVSHDSILVTINKPQPPLTSVITTRVMEEWDWEKYKKEGMSDKKIKTASELKQRIDDLLKREKIDLKPIFRKLYIPYQSGRNNVFFIDLGYTSYETGDVRLNFKLDKEPNLKEDDIKIEHTKTKWFEDYGEWSIFFDKPVDLSPLVPIFKKSYEHVTGAKVVE